MVKLQKLDKCVRVLMKSHLTVNESMIDVSNDIESLNKQRNENLIAIKEWDQKIREVNDEIMKQKDVITAGLESEQLNTEQAKKCSNEKSTGRAHGESRDPMVLCTICDENFEKNCYLEKHLESEHIQEKDFKCATCGKKFILQWRLEKHQLIHTSYFLANKTCPFDEIGCKFLHKAKEETNAVKEIDISPC